MPEPDRIVKAQKTKKEFFPKDKNYIGGGYAMKNYPVSVSDVDVDFEKYYAVEQLSDGAKSRINSADILAVPANYGPEEYYFGQETLDFIKYCRQTDHEHIYDILADEIKVISLHSFDIWMPVLFVASNVLLPIAINMVSNYIWEKRKGREKEETEVDVTFLVDNKGTKKSIHYKGDAKTFKETFDKIDISKL